jgi:hypothetical protein
MGDVEDMKFQTHYFTLFLRNIEPIVEDWISCT